MKQIENAVLKLVVVPWRKLVPLQNEDLKITTKEEFESLKASMLARGITDPLGVWDDKGKLKILDGHRRRLMFEALEKEGFTIPPVPCVSVKAKNEKEAREILLSNVSQYGKVTEEGLYKFMHESQINFDQLQKEFVIPGVDQDAFGESYFKDVAFSAKDASEDDIPEVKEKSTAKVGQIWKLGRHRLMCGDSTDPKSVAKLLNANKPDCVVTSPPYNVDIGYSFHNDKLPEDGFLGLLAAVMKNASELGGPNLSVFWNMGCSSKSLWWRQVDLALSLGLRLHRTMIWKKRGTTGVPVFTHTRNKPFTKNYHPHFGYELLFYFQRGEGHGKEKLSTELMDERQSDVWEISQTPSHSSDDQAARGDHPAAFPVKLAADALELFCDEWVYEPFGGSGSTLIAAEKIGRKCAIMEIDPHYVDVIIARWEKYAGKKAQLVSKPAPEPKKSIGKAKPKPSQKAGSEARA